MGLLFDNQNTQQQSGGGLLDGVDPAMLMMMMANRRPGGSERLMSFLAQENQQKQQAIANQMAQQQFALEQKKYGLEAQNYQKNWATNDATLKGLMQKQNAYNNAANNIENYTPQPNPIAPVIPEYNNVPLTPGAASTSTNPLEKAAANSMQDPMQGQNLQIPSSSYIQNLNDAVNKAAAAPKQSPFSSDPQLRKIVGNLIRTGEASNVKEAMGLLTNGGSYSLSPGATRFNGNNQPVASVAPLPTVGNVTKIDPATGQILFAQGVTATDLGGLVKDPRTGSARGGQGGTYIDPKTGEVTSSDTMNRTTGDQLTVAAIKRITPQIDALTKLLPQFQRAPRRALTYAEGIANDYFGGNFDLPSQKAEGEAKLQSSPEALLKAWGIPTTDTSLNMMRDTVKPVPGESPSGYKNRIIRALMEIQTFGDQAVDRLQNGTVLRPGNQSKSSGSQTVRSYNPQTGMIE